MKKIIEELFKFNRCLLGEGYDNALEFINHLMPMEIKEIPSGTVIETWTVPDEWVVRDAWLKDPKGKKIAEYKKSPLSLVVGSLPFKGVVDLEELKEHLHYGDGATPYVFQYYDKNWGFCFPREQVMKQTGLENEFRKDEDGNVYLDQEYKPQWESTLKEGKYEVFIDTEYRPGTMKIGVHTIPGSDKVLKNREILLFAHLDHPYQANDNLSGVACLVDMVKKLKFKHTIKLVFCPETIGSIAYVLTQNIMNVDFMIAVDAIGNNNKLTLQNAFNREHKINSIAHLAMIQIGKTFNRGQFRQDRGSDEYAFNDPSIGIPGLMFTRYPYKEYHTDKDTPEILNYENIKEVQDIILKIIEYWEKDYIPKRLFEGPLMRSRYNVQTDNPQFNLSWDYMIYSMDGKRSVAELCANFGLNFELVLEALEKMYEDGKIAKDSGAHSSKE